jgi:hypothetical protein
MFLTFAGSRLDAMVLSGRPDRDLTFRSYFLISSSLCCCHSGADVETDPQLGKTKATIANIPQTSNLVDSEILIVIFDFYKGKIINSSQAAVQDFPSNYFEHFLMAVPLFLFMIAYLFTQNEN